MIVRNSLFSIFRSGWKSVLFTVLLFVLTLLLVLGVSVWASISQFLDECDDFYTTIGLVEYMGTGYPNDTAYDAEMDASLKSFESSIISSDEAVMQWETPSRSFGYVDGFWRTDTLMPNRMLSVLVVGNANYDERHNVYSAIVMEALYSYKSEEETIIIIDGDFGAFKQEHYYLVFGEVYYGKSPLLHLRRASYNNAIAVASGVEIPYMVDITTNNESGTFFEIPDDSILLKVADTLPVTNNSVLVSATDNLMALLPFHQQELYIIEGRVFNDDEYAQGSKVVIISDLLARRVGVDVGDTIQLSVAVSDQPGVYNSYWVENGFSFSDTYIVIGITNTVQDKSWYVFTPMADDMPFSLYPVGYTVGQAVIRNKDAAEFSKRVQAAMTDRFHLTIYDQGYASVATPYRVMLRIVILITVVCGLLELAAIILFGFLFVYRQRETSETMRLLGASHFKISIYHLLAAGLLSLLSTALGAVAGYWLHGGILELVSLAAKLYTLIDRRFSNGNLTISRTLEFSPHLSVQFFILISFAVFLLALLSCAIFVLATFRQRPMKQPMMFGPKSETRTSRLRGGSVKFAILSLIRGGTRSLVVPILSASMVIFFGQLSATFMHYQEQLDAIYTDSTITGYYTDINGKQIGNQVLNAYDVALLYRSGYINTLSVSISEPLYFLGISKSADGIEHYIQPLFEPESIFARESLEAEILRGPDLTATNNIRTSPEFFYAKNIIMTFMDGYDETFLSVPSGDTKSSTCILPSSFMEQKGISLGDTVRVAINQVVRDPAENAFIYRFFDMQVIGEYEKQGAEDTIYAPLPLFFDTGLIWDENQPTVGAPQLTIGHGYVITTKQRNELLSTVFHSANFDLADSHQLIPLKDYLTDYGYSQVMKVSSVREFVVLQDSMFNNAVTSVQQQVQYIKTLYPFLYILAGIIGLIVSYLLVASRKTEFAIIRSLGTTQSGTFFSFFLEQSILCLVGAAAGMAVWAMRNPINPLHLILTAGFMCCYFVGSATAIIILNKSNVLGILLDKD